MLVTIDKRGSVGIPQSVRKALELPLPAAEQLVKVKVRRRLSTNRICCLKSFPFREQAAVLA